jgi:hypothetical protein
MNERQETSTAFEEKRRKMESMVSLLNKHPQVFQAGIGVEAFVEDFIKAFTRYTEYSGAERGSMTWLSNEMINFPQIIRPEGAEAFLEGLRKAAVKFDGYFGRE